jgi:recombinational DNA repair protein (RecF pathway)
VDDIQQQRCKVCGRPDRFNFHVPDEVWLAAVPSTLQGRVVCLDCFDGLAGARGVEYAAHLRELYFVGRCAAFRFRTDWAR